MPKTLQEQIDEVMDSFVKIYNESFNGGPSLLEIHYRDKVFKPFIEKAIIDSVKLTYERIRPENVIAPSDYVSIDQLDTNWKAWKGEV